MFLGEKLRQSLDYMLPPIGFEFDCYLSPPFYDSTLHFTRDALMFLPDRIAYNVALIVISLGFLLGAWTTIYGLIPDKVEPRAASLNKSK